MTRWPSYTNLTRILWELSPITRYVGCVTTHFQAPTQDRFVHKKLSWLCCTCLHLLYYDSRRYFSHIVHCPSSHYWLYVTLISSLLLLMMVVIAYCMCKYELLMSRLSTVIVWQTGRQTDRQTDRQTRLKLQQKRTANFLVEGWNETQLSISSSSVTLSQVASSSVMCRVSRTYWWQLDVRMWCMLWCHHCVIHCRTVRSLGLQALHDKTLFDTGREITT